MVFNILGVLNYEFCDLISDGTMVKLLEQK